MRRPLLGALSPAFAGACCVLWAVTCYAQTTGQRPSPLGPGLCSNCTVYNPGTQLPLPDQPIYPQLFYEAHATNYTVLSTDGGKLLTATANGVTFTVPAAGGPGTAGYAFGYNGVNAYALTVLGGGVINGACGGTPSATLSAINTPILLTTDGTNWQCAAFGVTTAVGGAITATGVHGFTNPGTTLTLTGTTAGNFFTVELASIGAGNTATAYTLTTNNGTSCTEVPNAFARTANGNASSDIWYCPNNAAAGSITFTTVPTGGSTIFVCAQEWHGVASVSPEVGIGNKAISGTQVTTASVQTNVNLTQASQLIVSIAGDDTTFPTGVGAGQTLIDSLASYQIGGTSGSPITHTFNWSGLNWVTLSIAVFKH
jgi:hypothetical protein